MNYKKLYHLQDSVLTIINHVEREFYLTGGTCLNRFYKELRYSDDLDFFTNHSNRYGFAVKNIKSALQEQFQLRTVVDSKNFIRFNVCDLLQIDFVNDPAVRYKDVRILENGYIIDTVENILSNKLTAIISRDNPKDVFDICLIDEFYPIAWKEILANAHQKAVFDDEDVIVRLRTFPISLLDAIQIIDTDFLLNFDLKIENVISNIAKAL